MTLDIHNWSSSAHQEVHKIIKDEIFLIVNQVDARLQNFEIQFLKEAAKFVRDFKSLTKEADESLAKHKALEFEIERLLRAVVSQDIMSIMQRVDYTTKTRRQQPRGNTKNDKIPSASKSSCIKIKEVKVEEHHRNLLLSKNKKHMSYECNIVKLAIRNDKSEVICAMWSKERLASPKPRKPRTCLRWSPTGRMFDLKRKIIDSSKLESRSDCSKVIQICLWCVNSGCSKHMTGNLKLLINFVSKFLGTVHFGNDHIAAILGYGGL
ncbi:hypothetical protein Tco_1009374 [Tanacetum coccineum]